MSEHSNSGKHAKPVIAELDGHVEAVAEAWMEVQFAAERTVTALDGFRAGWAAAEAHYDGRGTA